MISIKILQFKFSRTWTNRKNPETTEKRSIHYDELNLVFLNGIQTELILTGTGGGGVLPVAHLFNISEFYCLIVSTFIFTPKYVT